MDKATEYISWINQLASIGTPLLLRTERLLEEEGIVFKNDSYYQYDTLHEVELADHIVLMTDPRNPSRAVLRNTAEDRTIGFLGCLVVDSRPLWWFES